jgi:chromosome partitioning protein
MIITITNQKGGSGKSTLSALIVRALISEGHDVLAVDCDPQGGLTSLLGMTGKPGLYDAILGDQVEPLKINGIRGLGADHRLDKVAYTLSPYEIQQILKKYKADYIILDTPPTVQGISRAAAIAADLILIPADISQTTAGPTMYTLESLEAIKKKGKVLFIGKEPKPEAHGYKAGVFAEFKKTIKKNYVGIIPQTITAQKAAAGLGNVPKSIIEIIRGLV